MPSGIAFRDGALYVADIDKIYKYDNAEANLDTMPQPHDRLRRHAALRSAWLEISDIRQERLALRRLRAALQRVPAADVDVPGQAHQSDERHRGNRRARNPQQRRRRRRSARPATTGSPRTRAIGSARTSRTTSSTTSRGSARISVIRTATRATSRIRNSPWGTSARNSLRRCSSSVRTWRARHEVLHRESVSGGLQEQHHHR